MSAAAPPTITLTTDFGDRGPFVGVMKAAIWALAPTARIVDLGHRVPQDWPAEAGFWVSRVHDRFPEGTVHVAVIDPGVGSERAILAAGFRGHFFLAPDNGILPMIAGFSAGATVHRFEHAWLRSRGLPEPSATFHGRDIFAPLAACLASGTTTLPEIGSPASSMMPAPVGPPAVSADGIAGFVAAIDTWGNLITNIDGALLDGLREPRILFRNQVMPLGRTYTDVPVGGLLALVNSFGTLEIARAGGSAESLLGARRGDPVRVAEGG